MYTWNDGAYLMHHGIKGQRWGIRRFQNPDGTLTEFGKKRLHKQYDKEVKGIRSRVTSDSAINNRWLNSYNNAADRMNNGLTDKYNEEYDKKLGEKAIGHDYFNDEEYNSGYEKLFSEIQTQEYNKLLKSEITNDRGYKKIQKLIEKYGDESLSDFSRERLKELENL